MASKRGSQREYAVRDLYRADGWLAFRAPASLGVADVIAMHADYVPHLVEVKSDTAGPYHAFGPAKRKALSEAAKRAGARARLAHWPPHSPVRFYEESEWPQ